MDTTQDPVPALAEGASLGADAGLRAGDLKKFLNEVGLALGFDLDEEDSTPAELARFHGAKDDIERGQVTRRVAEEALQYIEDMWPAWIIERTSVYNRWCRVLAAAGVLKRYTTPLATMGQRPRTVTINGHKYWAP